MSLEEMADKIEEEWYRSPRPRAVIHHVPVATPLELRQLVQLIHSVERDGLRAEKAERHELTMQRRDAFTDCVSDYERLRGYLWLRYEDTCSQAEVNRWMRENDGGLFVEGVPEAEEWRDRYWPMRKEPGGQAE